MSTIATNVDHTLMFQNGGLVAAMGEDPRAWAHYALINDDGCLRDDCVRLKVHKDVDEALTACAAWSATSGGCFVASLVSLGGYVANSGHHQVFLALGMATLVTTVLASSMVVGMDPLGRVKGRMSEIELAHKLML